MSDTHPTKDSLSTVAPCPHGHQLRRKCITCDHEDACNDIAELTDQIIQLRQEREELRRDVARWVNAHRVAMIERDHCKKQAADEIERLQHQLGRISQAMGNPAVGWNVATGTIEGALVDEAIRRLKERS